MLCWFPGSSSSLGVLQASLAGRERPSALHQWANQEWWTTAPIGGCTRRCCGKQNLTDTHHTHNLDVACGWVFFLVPPRADRHGIQRRDSLLPCVTTPGVAPAAVVLSSPQLEEPTTCTNTCSWPSQRNHVFPLRLTHRVYARPLHLVPTAIPRGRHCSRRALRGRGSTSRRCARLGRDSVLWRPARELNLLSAR